MMRQLSLMLNIMAWCIDWPINTVFFVLCTIFYGKTEHGTHSVLAKEFQGETDDF